MLKSWHEDLLKRLVAGETMKEISISMKMSESYLSVVANSPLFKTRLEAIRTENYKQIGERLESYSHEALDKIVEKMRSAKADAIQLQAAKEILDRSGYVKVDKTMSVVADAEKVIREMSRLKGLNGTDITGTSSEEHDTGSTEPVDNGENGADLDAGRSRPDTAD